MEASINDQIHNKKLMSFMVKSYKSQLIFLNNQRVGTIISVDGDYIQEKIAYPIGHQVNFCLLEHALLYMRMLEPMYALVRMVLLGSYALSHWLKLIPCLDIILYLYHHLVSTQTNMKLESDDLSDISC